MRKGLEDVSGRSWGQYAERAPRQFHQKECRFLGEFQMSSASDIFQGISKFFSHKSLCR